jgi:hypothetical protein
MKMNEGNVNMDPVVTPTVIGLIALGGWLMGREKKEDKLVRLAREAEERKTEEVRRIDREKQEAERKIRETKEQNIREEIRRIRSELHIPTTSIKNEFAKLFVGEELDRAIRAWSNYLLQSQREQLRLRSRKRNRPRQPLPTKQRVFGDFKFGEIERFGNPVTVEEARMATERVRIAAKIAVMQKLTKRGHR